MKTSLAATTFSRFVSVVPCFVLKTPACHETPSVHFYLPLPLSQKQPRDTSYVGGRTTQQKGKPASGRRFKCAISWVDVATLCREVSNAVCLVSLGVLTEAERFPLSANSTVNLKVNVGNAVRCGSVLL